MSTFVKALFRDPGFDTTVFRPSRESGDSKTGFAGVSVQFLSRA